MVVQIKVTGIRRLPQNIAFCMHHRHGIAMPAQLQDVNIDGTNDARP